MGSLPSRTGRQMQRYNKGCRLVVGCIPYRYKVGEDVLQVLVISSRKGGEGMMFPKGGWELDESLKEAACRESLEEAGVRGNIENELGRWIFKSKRYEKDYHGYMFPLLVTQELDLWPEQALRRRQWMKVAEARAVCKHWWMKEALDILINRLSLQDMNKMMQHECTTSQPHLTI